MTAASIGGLRARLARHRQTNAFVVVVVVVMVGLAWWHRWTFDDGFINFRIVKQIEAGHGPVFNAGQRVEAFTSPLWLLALVVGDVLTPIRIEWVSVLLGITGTACGLGWAMAASRRLWADRDDDRMFPAGALVVLAVGPFWYFATSGLEGGLTFAWLGGSLYVLARWAGTNDGMSVGGLFVLGAGWLVRPELIIFSFVLAVAVLVAERDITDRSWWARVRVGWIFVLPVAYELFRMGYYASVLPNTAFAKEAGGARWGAGWDYLNAFTTHYVVWLPLLVLVIGAYLPLLITAARRERIVIVAWVTAAVLAIVYVVRVGGDYIPARLLLPGVFALCAPVAFMRVTKPVAATTFGILAIWAGACATGIQPPEPYRTGLGDHRTNVVTLADALRTPVGAAFERARHVPLSFELSPIRAEPGPEASRQTAALSAIGVLGYAFGPDVDVFDLAGLADPLTAHFTLTHRGLTGHEKFAPGPWVAARLTAPTSRVPASDVTLAGPFSQPLIPKTSGTRFDGQTADARAALQCGDLRRLHDSYVGHLGISDVFSNLVDSFGYSRISIPPDPRAAREKFCDK
jgi:arabinofuranosyltransferase